MTTRNLAIGMICLLQTIVGVLGNFSLLYHYLFLYFTECRMRSADLMLRHLTVANCLVILSKGVPQTMAALGLKGFLSDIGCKLVFYLYSVSRDVSIGSTCLLSVFQVITISPRNSRWAELKGKAAKYLGTSNIVCWVPYMMLNGFVPVYITDKWSNKNVTKKRDYGYCYSVLHDKITESLYAALILIHDVLCLVLMIWASSSMISILYRHKKQVRYLHSNSLCHRSSPETRDTKSILVLVSIFVFFCTLSSIFHMCLTVFINPSMWLVKTMTQISLCFPTVSPYILMSHDSRVSRPCFAWRRKTKSSKVIRNM